MLNKIRDYLDFAGLQYRNPDKWEQSERKCWNCATKAKEARKAFTELAKGLSSKSSRMATPTD